MLSLGGADGAWHPSARGQAAGHKSKQARWPRSFLGQDSLVLNKPGIPSIWEERRRSHSPLIRPSGSGSRNHRVPVHEGEGFQDGHSRELNQLALFWRLALVALSLGSRSGSKLPSRTHLTTVASAPLFPNGRRACPA